MAIYPRHPKVKCARCGNCCRIPVVPITHRDLKRLVKATGKPARGIVRFCPDSEMDYDENSGMWITFKSGRRAMVLRKERNSGRCVFQADRRACAVYGDRPMTCRTFPYNVYFEDDGWKDRPVDEITLNTALKCNAVKCREIDIDTLVDNVRKENREDREYHRLVRRWNRSEAFGKVEDFLKFLGF